MDAENKATYRRVTTGWLEDDGLRVITAGLAPDDLVVVGGLQQVRPNMVIKPAPQPMPSWAQGNEHAAEDAPQPAAEPAKKPTGSSRE